MQYAKLEQRTYIFGEIKYRDALVKETDLIEVYLASTRAIEGKL